MRALKIATGIGATALALSLATGAGFAAKQGGGNPGGSHPSFSGGGHPAFSGRAHLSSHVNVSRPSVSHFSVHAGTSHVSHNFATHIGRSSIHSHVQASHVTQSLVRTRHGTVSQTTKHATQNAGRVTDLHTTVSHVIGTTDPKNFSAHRDFARNAAFRPFLDPRWHPRHHLGWLGPLFWPYAYGDFFYDALWPNDYDDYDPFWAYGYGDIYQGIFSPYNYDEYVQGPRAPERMTALQQSVAQSCADEAAEVTGWPIDQIQAAVQPNAQQRTLLDGLGNAVVKASDTVKTHCPANVAFTPTGRLAEMQDRLEGMVQAVNIVQSPLAKFYDSLSDEQKARFNDIGAPGRQLPPQGQQVQNPQAQCGENALAWPSDQIDRAVHPNDAQRAKLDALNSAAAQAAETIKAACPSEVPSTPPDRLAAEGKRLQAMLQAVQTIRPKLEAFYNSLSDEQKARFNTVGRQLFAED
jgi:hypothetical protein